MTVTRQLLLLLSVLPLALATGGGLGSSLLLENQTEDSKFVRCNGFEAVHFDEKLGIFHLTAKSTSYAFRIDPRGSGSLEHLYFGARLPEKDDLSYLVGETAYLSDFDPSSRKNTMSVEWADYGGGDFRQPSFQVQYADGVTFSPMQYRSHQVELGKPVVDETQPASYVNSPCDAATLKILMVDPLKKLEVDLIYTVMFDHDVIIRRSVIRNLAQDTVKILSAQSMTIDLSPGRLGPLRFTSLAGSYGRERLVVTRPIEYGVCSIQSSRGASSHQHNPFVVISEGEPNEDHGIHYGFSLMYSGNFLASAERDQVGRTRFNFGINPFNFQWILESKQEFVTPEAFLVFSDSGLGTLSRRFHDFFRERVVRGFWRNQRRPILINSWEAMYFDISADKIIERLAIPASKVGIELVVVDDGWFGTRDNDTSSLGDWIVNERKLPGGLKSLANRLNDLGMKMGIWVEPEMISKNSNLFRAHPDWALHVDGRSMTESRNQLVLDLTRRDVRDYIVESISNILRSANIEYCKWDMNRHLTEAYSETLGAEHQMETMHRYILGVYDIMGRITSAFPHVLFESCSGGGGRFDPAMLAFMPQIWTTDNTDAISRVGIQLGTSLAYPPITMGSHVSAVPNAMTGRTFSIDTRSRIAMSGSFGFELDLFHADEDTLQQIREEIRIQRKIEPLVREGDFYRLLVPFIGENGQRASAEPMGVAAWSFVSRDKKTAVVVAVNIRYREILQHAPNLLLKGLSANNRYRVDITNQTLSGQTLMAAGLPLRFLSDGASYLIQLTAVDAL